jgi:hypothetical protein
MLLKIFLNLVNLDIIYLWTVIDDPSLTDYQVINLLRALYQIKYHDIDLFVNRLLSFTLDTRIDVRSASFLAICLFRIKNNFPEINIPLEQDILINFLRQAIEMGLHPTIEEHIEEYMMM